MRLYIDGQPLIGKKTGIGNYTNNLLLELDSTNKLSITVLTNQSVNFSKIKSSKEFILGLNNVKFQNKIYPYKYIRRLSLFNFLYNYPIDLFVNETKQTIFHATNFITLPTINAKQVITIHDLAFMKFPEVVNKDIYEYMMRWVPYSVAKADRIIADSYNTKQDIMEFLNVPEDKIDVIYLAADNRFIKQLDNVVKQVKQKYNLPNNYFLYLGTLEPKKNLPIIIEALAKLIKQYGSKQKLVVVGAKGWKFNPIFELVTELGLENDVIFTGYIADEDLPAIYSGATAFTFPSFYEGFGIPLLEAMQCEIPVIASNASCIPEVVGDGGILLDPNDVDGWTKAMHEISTNAHFHDEYVKKGLTQACKFSWEKTAQQTIEVYKKAIEG